MLTWANARPKRCCPRWCCWYWAGVVGAGPPITAGYTGQRPRSAPDNHRGMRHPVLWMGTSAMYADVLVPQTIARRQPVTRMSTLVGWMTPTYSTWPR
jgi:hypothetical protein